MFKVRSGKRNKCVHNESEMSVCNTPGTMPLQVGQIFTWGCFKMSHSLPSPSIISFCANALREPSILWVPTPQGDRVKYVWSRGQEYLICISTPPYSLCLRDEIQWWPSVEPVQLWTVWLDAGLGTGFQSMMRATVSGRTQHPVTLVPAHLPRQ
jgi:hypothetical protein